jgi:hypothetical protein
MESPHGAGRAYQPAKSTKDIKQTTRDGILDHGRINDPAEYRLVSSKAMPHSRATFI